MRIDEYLSRIDYPGRIIAAGTGKDGEAVLCYAITGRSANSRNRVLRLEDGVLRTKPFDESKVEDPSLIIYNALRVKDGAVILTNGDQTDTIYDSETLEEALIKRTYEPDEPNCTPRISLVYGEDGYTLSIIRKKDGEADRRIFSYKKEPGTGHIIHTYMGNGSPLPSFDGLPGRIDLPDSIEELSDELHSGISGSCRISQYVRYGGSEMIINDQEA